MNSRRRVNSTVISLSLKMKRSVPQVTITIAGLIFLCLLCAPSRANAQCVALTSSEQHQLNVSDGRAYEAIIDKHYRTGIRLARTLLRLSRKACEKGPELSALGYLGEGYYGLGQYKRSLTYYEPTLRLAKEGNHLVHETFSLYRMSLCYLKLYDHSRAQDFRNQLADVIPRVENSEPSYNRGYADIIRIYLKEIDAAMKHRSMNGAI
jgi:tetratricopeptide (TPR) repeat protein